MRTYVIILTCLFCVGLGCAESDRQQRAATDVADAARRDTTTSRDASDVGDDIEYVVVDAGPGQTGGARITTPPHDLLIARQDDPAANIVPIAVELQSEAIDSVLLAVNGSPEDILMPPYQYEWDISGRPPGAYDLSAWVVIDEWAYPGPVRTITIDDEDGFGNINLNVLAPEDRRAVDKRLRLSVRATGLASMGSFGVFADGRKIGEQSSSGIAVFELATEDWPSGPTRLQARLEVDEHVFWSFPRTVDVVHSPSNRFTTIGEPLDDWRDVEIAVGPHGRPVIAVTRRAAISVFTYAESTNRWRQLGDPVTNAVAGLADVEVAPDGEIFVAWSQDDPTEPWEYRRNAHVARWSPAEGAWVRLGDHLERSRDLDASSALLWLDNASVPHVAFATQDRSGENTLEVVRWREDVSAWERLGLPIDAPARAGTVAIGRDSDGELHLVWRSNFRVFTHRFLASSNAWLANARPTINGFAFDAVWRGDILTVPLFSGTGFQMMQSSGRQWSPLKAGTPPEPDSIGGMSGLAVDESGHLLFGWLRYPSRRSLFASRWADGRWQPLADHPIQTNLDADIEFADVAYGDGRLYVGSVGRGVSGWSVEVREFIE
jgi:hypothetical protein